jgi:hypothetical protein
MKQNCCKTFMNPVARVWIPKLIKLYKSLSNLRTNS